MLEFAHAVTGGVISSQIGNPLLSLPLCLASNLIIDYLPHWNPHIYTEKQKNGRLSRKTIFYLLTDAFIGLVLGLWVASRALPDTKSAMIIVLGCFLAVSADLLEAPFYLFNWQNKYIKKLITFQRSHQWNVSFWPGMLFQIFYVLLLLGFVAKIW